MNTFVRRFSLLLLAFFPWWLCAQAITWQDKVDPTLAEALKSSTSVPLLIVLQAQADLRPAEKLRTKAEKGRYVYESLSNLAEQTQAPVHAVLRQSGAAYESFWAINALSSAGDAKLVAQLAQMPEVARIERNPVWHLQLVPGHLDEGSDDRSLTPVSWGLTQINADDAWALGHTGAGAVVGGQDTGYEWQHPALKDKYRGWNGSSANHSYNWHDAIRNPIGAGSNSCGLNLSAPCDDNSHGTHTMGTMVGSTSASSVMGVAPDAKWIGCRNMEEGDGQPSTYIECFQWFIAPTDLNNQNPDPTKAPDVINNSWGCPISEGCNSSNFATMEAVINNVRAAGIVVVVSAGNSGSACSTVDDPPAIFSGSFAVGATNSSDGIAGFSSRGPVTVYGSGNLVKPDVSAPGVGIYSSVGVDNNTGTYSYANYSGTSMAGPHVAGLVALLVTAHPSLRGNVTAIETLIKNTATPRYATAPFCGSDNAGAIPNNVYGYGRVDALLAINSPALPVSLLSLSAKNTGPKVQLHWATDGERNCARFYVQRSCDGLRWEDIGQQHCQGNAEGTADYWFNDAKPCAGLNYYRLRQEDLDGQTHESIAIAVRTTPTGYDLHLTAPLGSDVLYIEVSGPDITARNWYLHLYAADGRLVQSGPVGAYGRWVLPQLPNGVYTALLQDESGRALAAAKWVKCL